MTQKIFEMKEKLIERMCYDMEHLGIERMDTMEASKVVDMIKDLAEAEKCCWETMYYQALVEAMEEGQYDRYGYDGGSGGSSGQGSGSGSRGGYTMSEGGANQRMQSRMGYRNQYGNFPARSSRGRGRRGYSEESIEEIRSEMESATPERREQMRKDLEKMLMEM